MSVWEFHNDRGTFTAFKSDQADEVEQAWHKRHLSKTCNLTIGKQKYIIDFSEMTQTNTDTNTARALRRTGPDGTVDARLPQWQWHDNKHNEWKNYYDSQNEQIEKAKNAGKKTLTINVIVSAHDQKNFKIDLNKLTQTNEDNKTRQIRRIETVVHKDSPEQQILQQQKKESGKVRARSPEGNSSSSNNNNNTSKAPANSAASPLPTVKDWQLLGPNKSCMWLNAEKGRVAAAGGSLGLKSIKIASFDMDDTLITPASGKVFAKDVNDWKWLTPNVVGKLQNLAQQENYHIVIFSNQGGVTKGGKEDPKKRMEIEAKIVALNQKSGGVPISAVCATHDDEYRKPSTKMWHTLQERFRAEGVLAPDGVLDLQNSFYCGDAAGRKIGTLAGRTKDFSCGDRKFAYNLNLKFYTPEELYRGEKPAAFGWDGMSPELIAKLKNDSANAKYPANLVGDTKKQTELVLMCGFPGSGKSTLARSQFEANGYCWVNRDTLKTPKKCQDTAENALKNKTSVVIDNTNGSPDDRKPYLDLAKKHGAVARAVVMDCPEELAKHLAKFREAFGGPHIPGLVYNIFKKKFVEPSLSEGFKEVMKVPIILDVSKMSQEQKDFVFSLS